MSISHIALIVNMVQKKKNTFSVGSAEYTDCPSAVGQDSYNECPGYDTKQSDGETPVILELWEMRSTPSLPSLSGPLWTGVVAPDRVISMGKIELFDIKTV